MNGLKRFFTLILAVCMVLNMVPFGVLAEEADSSDNPGPTEETTAETVTPTETQGETVDSDDTKQDDTVVSDDTKQDDTVASDEIQQDDSAVSDATEDTSAPAEVSEQAADPTLPQEYAAPAGSSVSGDPFDITISKNHRIPGLVILDDGTLVASADARWDAEKDGGGLDIVISKSSDQGATWNYSFAAYLGDNGNVYNAASSTLIDPLLITDGTNLYLLSDLFPAGYSLGTWNTTNAFSDTGIGFDAEGRLILSNDGYATYGYYLSDGKIYAADGTEVEGYTVDGWFNLYQDNTYVSNLFYADAPFKVRPTSYIALQTYVGGAWSDPELLNIKPEGTTWQVLGPGSGIVTSDGKLAFTAYDGSGIYLIYGSSGNWQTVRTTAATNESSIVELSDGTIRAFVKNNNNTVCYVDFTKDGSGYTAGTMQNTGITNTGWCMVSSMKYSKLINGKEAIFVCCPSRGNGYRYDGKIHVFLLNEDNSMEWLTSYQINDAFFAYSDMVELPGGESIGLLYEDGCLSYDGTAQGVGYSHISFVTLPISTIIPDAEDTEEPTDPTDPTEGEETTDPTESTETTDPTESTEPTEPEIPTVTDEVTGIAVTAPDVQSVTVVVAEESTPAEGYDVSVTYSIDLTDADGNPYTGSATVKIPVPDSLRNAASYTGSVDGTPVEVPMPVNGFFYIEMPHFSDLTISADMKEVDINLFVGQTFTITDLTGNYESDSDTVNPDSKVTMTVTGKEAETETKMIVSDDDLENGRMYLLYNQRAGGVLTSTAADDYNSRQGLVVNGAATVDNTEKWYIYPYNGGFAVKYSDTGKYLNVAVNSITLGDDPQALKFEYEASTSNTFGGFWLISAVGSNGTTYYASDFAGSSWSGATAYEVRNDEGNYWTIYEIVPETTEITFTANAAGDTQAKVGNVIYNISIAQYLNVDVTLYEGMSKTFTIDGYKYTAVELPGPDTNSATISVAGHSTSSKRLEEVTSIESGKQYLLFNQRAGKTLTSTEYDGGLKLDGTDTVNNTHLWTITSTGEDKMYTVQYGADGDYLYVASGSASMSDTSVTLQLDYFKDGCWLINESTGNYGLNDYGNTGTKAAGYGNASTDTGSWWTIYEIASNEAADYTEVTFTGVKSGTTTTAIVGHVQYNITVQGVTSGEITDLNNIIGTQTVDGVDMAGKPIKSLDITAGVEFDLGVDASDYDFIEWSSDNPSAATVSYDGKVTGVAEGTANITAKVVKDGVVDTISIPVKVRPSVLGDADSADVFFYIEELTHVHAYYSMYLESHSTTDAWLELEPVSEGRVILYQRPIGVDFGALWVSGPDEGYALAFMSATNSQGLYNPIKNGAGELGNDGSANDDSNAVYFYNQGVYDTIKGFSDWDDKMEAMVRKAAASRENGGLACQGGHGFSRNSGESSVMSSSLSFRADPLPTVTKAINGVMHYNNEQDPNVEGDEYLRKDFEPYRDGMIATVKSLVYYTVTVTLPRPGVWKDGAPALTYSDVILQDEIENAGDTKAYFYQQDLDKDHNGVLEDDEIPTALDNGAKVVDGDMTTLDITEIINETWEDDEQSRTFTFYVVYKIDESDKNNPSLTNNIHLTYNISSVYSSGASADADVSLATMSIVSNPLPDIVIDFGLPVTITGLDSSYNLKDVATTVTLAEGTTDKVETAYGYYTIKHNYDASSNYVSSDLTYTPTKILQDMDVIALRNADGEILNSMYVYPASTVFYEEGFATLTGFTGGSTGSGTQEPQYVESEGENYGYTDAYKDNSAASSGTQATSTSGGSKATFEFTGTGVDIYANCNDSTGVIVVMIRNSENKIVKFAQVLTKTAAGTTPATSQQGGTNYHLPVYSVTDLTCATYSVTIQHTGKDSSVYLDGFRVYNTLENLTNTEVYPASEKDPTFIELRDYVLTAYDVTELATSGAAGSQYYKKINETTSKIIESVYDANPDGNGAFIVSNMSSLGAIDTQIDPNAVLKDLLDNGPKNEIYLWPGMSVTFRLDSTVASAQIGLKAITGEKVTYTINDGEADYIKSTIDMFYDLPTGNIVITNTGDTGVLSITKLKVIKTEATATALASITEETVSYSLRRMVPNPAPGPVITGQPADVEAALNEEVAVSLEAEGEELSYQWYYRNAGDEEFQASSCNTEVYYTTMTEDCDGRQIYCVITDAQGNQVTSDTVTLTLAASSEPEAIPGNIDGDDNVDVDDVLALLWYVLFPDEYPINANADFDGSNTTDVDDVLMLLWHVLFPEEYPLKEI